MRLFAYWRGALHCCRLALMAIAVAGCASLLPDARQETQTPWHSYAEAQQMFGKIVPGQTRLSDLQALGLVPGQTPNVALLAHADLLRRLVVSPAIDMSLLDPGLQECITAHQTCFAYEIEQLHLTRTRNGNFWLDFLNFKRSVDVSGWQFDAIVVIKNDLVVYKLWSGKPSIHQLEEEHSPLGPLQGLGSSMLGR